MRCRKRCALRISHCDEERLNQGDAIIEYLVIQIDETILELSTDGTY